jgi:mRNA interferase RelE/StbE
MSWTIEIKPTAEKQYFKLDRKTQKRIVQALRLLEGEENPLQHQNVGALTGQLAGDYRLRVGEWRILFSPDQAKKNLNIYAILPRGKAY